MKYNQLNITSQKSRTRVGRGISAGGGKTAGRGTKGQNARKSGGTRPGFEGGQNPLMQRLPKLSGFKSIRPKAEAIYTSQLQDLKGTVDNFSLFAAGLTSSPYNKVKVVVSGAKLSNKVQVKLQAASKQAVEAIKKAGGQFEVTQRPQRTAKENKPGRSKRTKKN